MPVTLTAEDFNQPIQQSGSIALTANDFVSQPQNNIDPRGTLAKTLDKLSNSNLFVDPLRIPAESFIAGEKRGLTGLAQLGAYPIDKIFGTDLRGQLQAAQQGKDAQFQKELGQYGPGAEALRFAGELAPMVVGGEAAAIPKLTASALANAPRAAQIAGRIGGDVGLGALLGMGTYTPELENMGKKAALGAAFGLIPGGASLAIEGFRNIPWTKMLGANISKEDLPRVMEALGESKTGLGDAINSPMLKKFHENILGSIPLGGVQKTYGKVGEELEQQGQGILDQLAQIPPENIPQTILDELQNAKSAAQSIKNQAYNLANQEAEKAGLQIPPSNYQQTATRLLEESASKDFPELNDMAISGFLEKAASEKPTQTFKDFGITRGLLNQEISKAHRAGEDFKVKTLTELRSALDKDRDLAIESTGNEAIKDLFSKAQETYKQVYAPFKTSEMKRYLNKDADADTIVNYFLRTGKTDRPTLANQLVEKLPKETRDLVAHDYFSRAFKEDLGTGSLSFNPREFVKLWKGLGPKTRDVLIPDAQMKRGIENYVIKAERNPEALNRMYNPKTGARNTSWLPAFAAGALGGFGTLGGAIAGSQALNKLLTSPSVRRKVADSILKPKTRKGGPQLPSVESSALLNLIGQ